MKKHASLVIGLACIYLIAVPDVTPQETDSLAVQVAKSFSSLHRRIDEIETQLQNYRAVADISPIPVALISSNDHTNVYANPAYAELMECQVVELLGDGWTHFHHPEDLAPLLAAWRNFLTTEEDIAFRWRGRYVSKKGKVIMTRSFATKLPDGGSVMFIVPEEAIRAIDALNQKFDTEFIHRKK